MLTCQRISMLALPLVLALLSRTLMIAAAPPITAKISSSSSLPAATPKPAAALSTTEDPKFVRIVEDVIPDIENSTQKVLRVNPLEAEAIREDPKGEMDSSLYKIQPLMIGHRPYVNSRRMRKGGRKGKGKSAPAQSATSEAQNFREEKEFKRKPKKKQLHFLYNQDDIQGHPVAKQMDVRVAPGAYPVYYAVSKSNGRFGKFPFKGFRNEADFTKYVVKSKLEPTDLTKHLQE